MNKKKIAILGAGPSGLAQLRAFEALRLAGATDLPEIRIWQDADGKLWTLDHRRLAAFRMAKLDSVPFRWATDEEVANQMWKMTTKTNGISIKLKLADGQSMTIQ